MRPDLGAVTPDVLAELTNPGSVRRATKELAAGARFTFTMDDDVVTAADDEVTCVLGTGPFETWTCSCAAGERCRHLVRAVLDWQLRTEPPPQEEPGVAPQKSVVAPSPEVALPPGLVATVTVTPTQAQARVRLLHPDQVAVRFLVGRDPRYARCECGTPGCTHIAVARAVLDRRPEPGSGVVVSDAEPVVVPAAWRADWRRWVGQLLDLGLPTAAELMAGAVRLATSAEQAGLVHPAAVLREIAEQLELRLDHSGRLSPVHLIELIGELEARLRALDRGTLPAPVVAGTAPSPVNSVRVRLVGVGAEYRQVGGWHEVRAYVADTGTGAVRTVTLTRSDTEDVRHTPAELALARVKGARMIDWAAGRGLLPSARRVDDELVPPRGRWTMRATPNPDVDPAGLAPIVGSADQLPAALGPRRPADGVGLIAVTEVRRATVSAGLVTAVLIDRTGAEARLLLRPDPRAEAAGPLLAEALAGPVSAVAGRWRRAADGPPVVTPTALWVPGRVLLPQLGVTVSGDGVVDDETDLARTTDPGPGADDPWLDWWTSLGEALGRLLVTGTRRGARAGIPALRECADRAEALGLGRAAALVGRIAEELTTDPILDAAVLLALADR